MVMSGACDTGSNQATLPTLAVTNTPPTSEPTLTLPSDLGPGEGTARPTDVAPIDNPTATTDPTLAATIEAINQAAGTAGAIVGAPSIQPPMVGTIATALPTEDPDAGLLFDEIYFSQTGGGTTLVVQVYPDGRVLRDGQQFSIAQDQVVEIDTILDEIDFFGMQSSFTSVGGSPNAYVYEISVSRGDDSRNVVAEDGLIPPQLQNLFSLLLEAGLTRPGA
jgi:hypothetical protein